MSQKCHAFAEPGGNTRTPEDSYDLATLTIPAGCDWYETPVLPGVFGPSVMVESVAPALQLLVLFAVFGSLVRRRRLTAFEWATLGTVAAGSLVLLAASVQRDAVAGAGPPHGGFGPRRAARGGRWRHLHAPDAARPSLDRRLHSSIGDLPPAEYEAAYYGAREASAVA